jgi:putative sterol carrier protein
MVTEEDIIELLKKKFNPEKAADLKKRFVAVYAVENGGTWQFIIENQKLEIIKGPAEKYVCKMTFIDVESWYKLATGEIDGMAAFTMGLVKPEGARAALEKFGQIMGAL